MKRSNLSEEQKQTISTLATVPGDHEPFTALKATLQSFTFPVVAGIFR
ncbi:hypothetical protein [Escherichia coli]|nr:hypothetical protein [Escherichia coli]HBA6942275.1 hypothetical protein [Escherichia coli]HBA8154342.1 hypothetical protein [Escherichia coli]